MRIKRLSRLVGASALAIASTGVISATAASAAAQTGDPTGVTFGFGNFPGTLPSSCTFNNGFAAFTMLSGTAVEHETVNKNGDWGGITVEGQAVFSEDGTALFTGHLTFWGGGGNNAKGQSTDGFTVDYHGTDGAGGWMSLHVNGQMTTNAAGTPTANVTNASISCG